MAEVEIRQVRSRREVDELEDLLWRVLWEPIDLPRSVRESFRSEGEELQFVARSESELAGGLVASWVAPEVIELRHLGLREGAQGQGIGGQLVRKLISFAMGAGCTVIETTARNTSVGFFTKLGFVPRAGEAPQHPAFHKHGITFKLMRYRCDAAGREIDGKEKGL